LSALLNTLKIPVNGYINYYGWELFMKKTLWIMVLVLGMALEVAAVEQLSVYPPVPGLTPSEFYSFRVREVSSSQWLSPFAWVTRCVDEATAEATKYFEHLADWSNTYCNFEMANDVPVEVEITRLNPSTGMPVAIQKAVPHPRHKVCSWRIEDGKAYVIIDKPVLFAVDIDGQMDDQNTGKGYSGPPIHTVTVFANPFITDKPDPAGSGVYAVNPGEIPSDTGTWTTLYFKPGVHDIGKSFRVHMNKSYYIPGDAMVYGTFNNDKTWSDGSNIRVFGHGTLSGERIPHPADDPETTEDYHYKPIDISGAGNTRVEGITIADSANHSLMLVYTYSPSTPTDIRWVKIFTWRANGDGINPFGNGLIEDCFLRTQDDSCYVNGRGIRRTVYWNDYNGAAFMLTPVGTISNPDLVVEDCDIIYARAGWDNWAGGRIFNMRAEGGGAGGDNVTFRNINVEDARPTLQQFFILTEGLDPYRAPSTKRGSGDIFGILFQNITIAAPSVLGEPDILWGYSNAHIRDLIFDNVTVGGQHYDSIDDFLHNEYVHDLQFVNTGGGDTTPPTPNPMTWATVPYATGTSSIAMVATTASDPSGVEYYFTCTAGGGHNSGWQSSPSYEDTGLQPETQYTYTVKARDLSANLNETTASSPASATTNSVVPTFVAAGAVASGNGTITPALPSGIATNDILLLFLETSNQAISISNQNGGTWTAVTNSPQYCGTAAGTTGARLTAFWSRYNGTQGAPTASDSGDHQLGRIIAIRGAVASGNPWDVTAGGVEAVDDTSGSIPGATTTVADTLVVTAIATSLPDASSTSKFSGWTNANLTSLTERTDNSVKDGNGGGLAIATGVKATAGAYGNTAVTLANAAYKGMISIAIKKN